ncbi:MAG: Beta sliding clamp [Phycisphaerae bacterium]|nr:Beta sliding clamp [Phycisphaerae bacterium]
MKLSVPRQALQDALAATSALTSGRTPKPILNCVRMAAADKLLRIDATDGEVSVSVSVPAIEIQKKGTTVVHGGKIFEIVREMSDVEVALDLAGQQCVIRGEGSEFRIYVQDAADFPPVPNFEGDPELVLNGAAVRRAIGLTLYAAAKDTTRYAISGVLWERKGKALHLVATDGRRLARAQCPVVEGATGDFRVIIPTKALHLFERVCVPRDGGGGSAGWTVDLRIMPNQVMFRCGQNVLASALVEGHFPNYEDVIPKETKKTARLEAGAFHSAVRRAQLLTTEESRAVRLAFEKQRLTITSRSPEQGEATVEMPVNFDGDPIEIAFNPSYLIDPLKSLEADEIQFRLTESTRPGIIRGEDANDFLYVVMPVAL